MAFGGAEVLVHDFLRATREEAQSAVLCLDASGPLGQGLQSDGVRVDVLGRKGGVEPRVVKGLRDVLTDFRPEVVCAHQYAPYSYAAMALPLVYPRPGLVFVEHGRHYPDARRPKRVLANNLVFLRYTQRVVAVCGYIKRLLVANEGIPSDRIEVIFNGVDPSRFDVTPDRDAARASLGMAPEDLAVVCVARFHPVKDHPTLVRGFARAARDVPSAKLYLVGGGDDGHLRALASELGITERVVFTGVRRDIPEVYAAADLFAMSSLSEGTSVTLLESMLSRRASVVTDVGGNPEIVERGHTGLLVPRGDHEALGLSIAELLRDPSRREKMGERGRKRVLALFTKDRMHRGWLRVLADAARR
jgi:glycosyltransferase involved in cell wall biosynthesis